MKDTDYAYCVARIRANETKLLTGSQLKDLCYCTDFDEAVKKLSDYGWVTDEGTVKGITDYQQRDLWELLRASVPDKSVLDVFCVLNDYFNIKTCIKCYFSVADPFDYYIYPTTLDLGEITEIIGKQSFSGNVGKFIKTAEKAFNAANITERGQSAEIIVDKAAVDCLCEYAKMKNNALINEICAFLCDTANIKTALRINSLNKSRDFAQEAIGNCVKLDRNELIKNAFYERERLIDYLCNTEYKDGVLIYEESSSLFDKWCDNSVIKMAVKAKYMAFGFDPVCAYYYKKQNEIKNVRMILTAKKSGLSAENTEKRIRFTDV